jgi:HK97 family phage major capsid protein
MSNANAGHIKTDASTADGQDVQQGLDFVEKIESMVSGFVGEERERASLHDGRITSLEEALSLVKIALRAIDEKHEPGQKFMAAGWGEHRDKALAEVGRTCHVAYLVHKGAPVDRDRYEADMSGATAAGGGAQIPKLVLPEIIRFMEEASLPRLLFNKLQMENRSIDFPVRTTGPLMFWPDEGKSPWAVSPLGANQPPKPTNPPAGPTEIGFDAQGVRLTAPTLNAKTMMAVDKISGEYLEDAVSNESLMTVLGRIYLEASASEETRVALVGNTVNLDPFNGVINTAGIGTQNVGSLVGPPVGGAKVTDLLALLSKLEDVTIFGERTVFICNTKCFTTKIMGLQAETSTPIYMHNFNSNLQMPFGSGGPPDPVKGAPGYLLGKPIYTTKWLPDGDTAGEAWIVVLAADRCWMGIRRGITIDFSPLPFWTAGAMGIRLAQRIGFLYPQPTAIAKGTMAA